MDWLKELDKLKAARQYTDTELAATLGISKGFLSDLRSGRRPMPTAVRLAIVDRMGYDLTRNVLISILPIEIQQKVMDIEVARGKRAAAKKAAKAKSDD
jgi:DNA-binding Xre family transcriptional regulator